MDPGGIDDSTQQIILFGEIATAIAYAELSVTSTRIYRDGVVDSSGLASGGTLLGTGPRIEWGDGGLGQYPRFVFRVGAGKTELLWSRPGFYPIYRFDFMTPGRFYTLLTPGFGAEGKAVSAGLHSSGSDGTSKVGFDNWALLHNLDPDALIPDAIFPGDAHLERKVDITDPVFVLNFLFAGRSVAPCFATIEEGQIVPTETFLNVAD